MGQGATRETNIDNASNLLQLELQYSFSKTELLGQGKVFTTFHCDHKNVPLVIKVHRFPSDRTDDYTNQVRRAAKAIEDMKEAWTLENHPGLLPLGRLFESSRAVYLVRQYLPYNLHDRFSTRPFLLEVEKRWCVYQLLRAVAQAHESGWRHGDIKTENILVTTWGWIFLSDFAPQKPDTILQKSHWDWDYWFVQSKKTRCYVAPERFIETSTEDKTMQLTEQHDVFGAGCCIYEIFTDGDVLFDYKQMLAFKRGDFDPCEKIRNNEKIPSGVSELIMHMIQLDPRKRARAMEYIELPEFSPIFPPYFGYLYDKFFNQLLSTSPKSDFSQFQVELIKNHIPVLFEHIVGYSGPLPELLRNKPVANRESTLMQRMDSEKGHQAQQLGHIKARLERVDKAQLELENLLGKLQTDAEEKVEPVTEAPAMASLDNPKESNSYRKRSGGFRDSNVQVLTGKKGDSIHGDGLVLVANLVCHAYRNARQKKTKIIALELMGQLSKHLGKDKVRISRLITYIIESFPKTLTGHKAGRSRAAPPGESPVVIAKALDVLTDILQDVQHVDLKETPVFTDYIFPVLVHLSRSEQHVIVRLAVAKNLATIANVAKKFIEKALETEREAARDLPQGLQDPVEKLTLLFKESFNNLWKEIESNTIKMLLQDTEGICDFLGKGRIADTILMHFMTIMNFKDAWVRVAFLETVVEMSRFLDPSSVQRLLLPLVEPGLQDTRPEVAHVSLKTITELTKQKVVTAEYLTEDKGLVEKAKWCLFHPSVWVRNQAVTFICTAAEFLGTVKTYTHLLPKMSGLLRSDVELITVDREALLAALHNPIPMRLVDGIRNGVITCNADTIKEEMGLEDGELVNLLVEKVGQVLAYLEEAPPQKMDSGLNTQAQVYFTRIEPTVAGRRDDAFIGHMSTGEESSTMISFPSISLRERPREVQKNNSELINKINNALGLPPDPPDLGKLAKDAIISTSSFYKNKRPPFSMVNEAVEWEPRGQIIACLSEHQQSVNEISVSQDNIFFATGSSDGTVKIWNPNVMTSNPNLSSMATYQQQRGSVLSVTVCDSSCSVASAASDGSVHVFKVEHNQGSYGGLSYNKMKLPPREGPVVKVTHFNTLTESLLVYGTHAGKIHGWDLRAKKEAWVLPLERTMGPLTTLCVGPYGHSIIAGTGRGYVNLWDLRYEMTVQSWRYVENPPIVHLTACPFSRLCGEHQGTGPLLFVSALMSNEIAAYDMNTWECRVRFRANDTPEQQKHVSRPNRTSAHSSMGADSRRGTSIGMKNWSNRRLPMHISTLLPIGHGIDRKAAIEAVNEELTALCSNFGTDHDAITGCLVSQGNFVITAGHDRVVRYWDVKGASKSRRLCGPSNNYRISYAKRASSHEELFEEYSEVRPTARSTRQNYSVNTTHQDIITDLKTIQGHQNILLTSSRDGVVKAWI